MKILLAAPHYPPRFIGGVELYTRRLAHRLRAAGHQIAVVAMERLDADQPEPLRVDHAFDDGVTVYRMATGKRAGAPAFVETYLQPEIEAWIGAWLARERPDVVHLHSGYLLGGAVLRAAANRSVPVVVTLHDFWFICPRATMLHPSHACCTGPETPFKCAWCLSTEQRRYRIPEQLLGASGARRLGRWFTAAPLSQLSALQERTQRIEARREALLPALAGAAAVLSPSRFLREEMVRAGIDRTRIEVLPYGIEARRPLPPRSADSVAVRLGFLGQIAPHKGIHILVAALKHLPHRSIELIIHGDLTREPRYVREIRALAEANRRIVFAGPLGQGELDVLFRRIDMLAVPSVWYENSPLVIHEARRAGLPVLASRLGGMAELVRDGEDGLLAEAGDPASFAQQIDRLISEPGMLARLRQEVKPPPTLDTEVQALIGIYERVSASVPMATAMELRG
jgi:glycosyltransferase involved in cell wall biosynthesis